MFSAATKSGKQASAANYIEDVFSTYLYTGNGSTQTITNGIDLAGKGGLVWIKSRSAATNHNLFDTAQGATKLLHSNTTGATVTDAASLTSFNSNGFSLGTGSTTNNEVNVSAATYVSWAFRKQAKFFDVVTYTGTGANRTISHNLGSVPGCIIVKRTDTTGNWQVYHNGLTSAAYSIQLNLTNAQASATTVWNSTAPTSTVFSVGTSTDVNASGGTYVAYLFAHNAGGFGLTGTDNVISCGSFTVDGSSNADITLGYEPQYVLMKAADDISDWAIMDNMRGFSQTYFAPLAPNTSDAEGSASGLYRFPTATGFGIRGLGNPSKTWIYIAIRRGPMRVPTSGTSVFAPITSGGVTGTTLTTNFPVDMLFTKARAATASNPIVDRLRGVSSNGTEQGAVVYTNSTGAESGTTGESLAWNNTGFQIPSGWGGVSSAFEAFRRAPNFFDEVCYTGTGSATTFNHNLGAVPEMMWVKRRNTTGTWRVYASGLTSAQYALTLSSTAAQSSLPTVWNSTAPTSSVFSVGTSTDSNASGSTYVTCLFASCPGVSKVGSYTGTGATQTINCGFTGGARFVLIKRTDSTGDWYVWDTARGMVSGTDPSLLLNSTAAEVNANSVYTTAVGFQIVSTAAGINASGGSYIFLAIA